MFFSLKGHFCGRNISIIIIVNDFLNKIFIVYLCIESKCIRGKTFKSVKNGFRVALKSTETRKSQPCPLHIGWALVKSYGDLFYAPKSLPHFLLLAKFSSDNKTISKIFF